MSGKFWGSDSEEEEEEDFFSESEEEDDDENLSNKASRWVQGAAYGSDEEDEKREVRAKHERLNDQLVERVESIRAKIEANDWNSIAKEFEDLNKIHSKWLPAWGRSTKEPAPLYIALLVELKDFHVKCYSDNKYKKKLSATNKKSLNGMQQKIKRNNAPYANAIKEFRQRKSKVEAGELDESELIEEVQKEQPKTDADDQGKEEEKEIEWTVEVVDEHLTEIIASRGRKGCDRKSQIKKLEELLPNAQNNFQSVQILLHIIGMQFDTTSMTSHMGTKVWKQCIEYIKQTMKIIEEDRAVLKAKNSVESQTPTIDVQNSIFHFLERLEKEFFKSLQDNDIQKVSSYIARMRDVTLLLSLTEEISKLYESFGDTTAVIKAALIQMKYRHQTIQLNENQGDSNELADSICLGMATGTEEEIENLAKLCFKLGDERQKTHAMLYFITFLATHDKYAKARNLMLMSHIQDSVTSADVETQILFNRTMALLGLSAFRAGRINDCHNFLVDLYSSMKYKELLAQGTTRHSDKGAEQEMIESRRQMPYHMHINTEILETVYFICAILLEVPNSAANAFDSKRKPISKILKKYLEGNKRQTFAGPPEAPRDYFVAAAKALIRGDWEKCCNLLFSLSVWQYITDSERLQNMVKEKIKEEGVRTFLFTVSTNYDSFSAERLSSMFELDKSTIHSIVSKMIIRGEIEASWDNESGCIVMHKIEPSKLQNLSLQFADKIGNLSENNEKLIELFNFHNKNDSRSDNQGNRKTHRNNQQRSRYNREVVSRRAAHKQN